MSDSATPPSVPDTPTELECGVCGRSALVARTVTETPGQPAIRLICRACDAHRVA